MGPARHSVALTHPEHGKSQFVRLVDVFALGPFMVASGAQLQRDGHRAAGVVMAASGVATVLYNLHNYRRLRR